MKKIEKLKYAEAVKIYGEDFFIGGALKKKGAIKKMKSANLSKWMYMRSIADIPKLGAIEFRRKNLK